jgi:SAM-dependent methyltransferase
MSDVTSRWRSESAVAGFATAAPNRTLVDWARGFVARGARPRLLDLGCGAARNSVPLAELGFRVTGLDLSAPMLDAARARAAAVAPPAALQFVRAPMAPLPFRDGVFDVVVAHGIWNLARSDAEFRRAVAEAARVARAGAGLFLFTFSRATLPPQASPVPGERWTFTQFGGEPQVFLTEDEVVAELRAAGFERDPAGPLTHLNVRGPLAVAAKGPPAIWEGTFRRA